MSDHPKSLFELLEVASRTPEPIHRARDPAFLTTLRLRAVFEQSQ
jgi:hypothetical protein